MNVFPSRSIYLGYETLQGVLEQRRMVGVNSCTDKDGRCWAMSQSESADGESDSLKLLRQEAHHVIERQLNTIEQTENVCV